MSLSSFVRPAALALALAVAFAAAPATAGRCGRTRLSLNHDRIAGLRGTRRTANPTSPLAVRKAAPATARKAGAATPAATRHWEAAPMSAPGEHPVLILRGGSR